MRTIKHTDFHVLLVEDNEGDIILTLEAFEENKITCDVSVVKDGKEALDYVFHQGKYKSTAPPDLILLDINLPKKNGLEVLQQIKERDRTKHIPIIVLTTSTSKNDVMAAYQNYANCYITKPMDLNSFIQAISRIENFWLDIATLPH
ncbi:response regulator [Negadavirga shengliensis]|uniref:Response regulator n=1 Tax=Negadavirga shengliensis TaxID=1389218 RepID=A0ABV9SWV4_9BACT